MSSKGTHPRPWDCRNGIRGTGPIFSTFYHCCDQIPDRNNLKEGGLPWLIISGGSVHGHLAPCIWVENHDGGSV
jgi:hypothetical protein